MFQFTKTHRRNALAVRLFISKAMNTLPLNRKHFFGQRVRLLYTATFRSSGARLSRLTVLYADFLKMQPVIIGCIIISTS